MKKLKSQYWQSVKFNSDDYLSRQYPHLRSTYFREFSTRQERSFYFLHYIEYKNYFLTIRAARGKNLPDSWDDLPTYVTRYAKSWKHNSRRKHQYYHESDMK